MAPKILLLCVMIAGFLGGCNRERRAAPRPPQPAGGIDVYFSPQTDCRKLIIQQIRAAKERILVQAYSFTSERIAKALAEAQRSGVKVTVIVDADKADKKSEAAYLVRHGVETYIDSRHDKAHNKVLLIDGRTIVTGSYNFSDNDDVTADNILVITDRPKLMEAYEANFREHLAHSQPAE